MCMLCFNCNNMTIFRCSKFTIIAVQDQIETYHQDMMPYTFRRATGDLLYALLHRPGVPMTFGKKRGKLLTKKKRKDFQILKIEVYPQHRFTNTPLKCLFLN